MGQDSQDAEQTPQSADQTAHAEQQRRRGLASALDPIRGFDRDAVAHAQAMARAQAQAATTVAIATIVSLVTSAFAFVAAFAWNNFIQELFSEDAFKSIFGFHPSKALQEFIFAVFVTLIAVIVIITLNRVARKLAADSAFKNSGQ